jgi:hypothetical protein
MLALIILKIHKINIKISKKYTAQQKRVLYKYTSFWKEIPSLRYSTPARTKTYTLYFVGKIRYHCLKKSNLT